MRRRIHFAVAALVALLIAFAGCKKSAPAKPRNATDSIRIHAHGIGGGENVVEGATGSTTTLPPRTVRVDGKDTLLSHGATIWTQADAEQPLVVASLHLKDRTFHPNKAAELRRAEARKWSSAIKPWLTNTNDLIVVTEAFDEVDSAPVKALAETERAGIGLEILRPTDNEGHAWTHQDPSTDTYHRWTFILASTGAVARLRSAKLEPSHTNSVPRGLVLELAP